MVRLEETAVRLCSLGGAKTMTQEKKDELKGIIQLSLARAEEDYASVGRLHAKRINLTSEESVDYLAGFNFRIGGRERAAIQEFQGLLLEIEKMEQV
jgi:predicted solute-binding protein